MNKRNALNASFALFRAAERQTGRVCDALRARALTLLRDGRELGEPPCSARFEFGNGDAVELTVGEMDEFGRYSLTVQGQEVRKVMVPPGVLKTGDLLGAVELAMPEGSYDDALRAIYELETSPERLELRDGLILPEFEPEQTQVIDPKVDLLEGNQIRGIDSSVRVPSKPGQVWNGSKYVDPPVREERFHASLKNGVMTTSFDQPRPMAVDDVVKIVGPWLSNDLPAEPQKNFAAVTNADRALWARALRLDMELREETLAFFDQGRRRRAETAMDRSSVLLGHEFGCKCWVCGP